MNPISMKIWDLLKFENRPMLVKIGFMVHDEDIPASRRRDLAVDGLSIIEYYLKSLGPDVTRFCEEEKIHELYVFQMIAREENLKVNNCKDFLESIRILQDRLKVEGPQSDDPEELLKWIGHFLVVIGFVVERRMLEESLIKIMTEKSKERVL